MSNQNEDLVQIQKKLGDLVNSLNAAKRGEKEPDKIKAINNELIEVNHRITMVGAVIFHGQTTAITGAAKKVAGATNDVQAEIKKLDSIKDFVKAMSGFLGLVDKVIDLAKTAV